MADQTHRVTIQGRTVTIQAPSDASDAELIARAMEQIRQQPSVTDEPGFFAQARQAAQPAANNLTNLILSAIGSVLPEGEDPSQQGGRAVSRAELAKRARQPMSFGLSGENVEFQGDIPGAPGALAEMINPVPRNAAEAAALAASGGASAFLRGASAAMRGTRAALPAVAAAGTAAATGDNPFVEGGFGLLGGVGSEAGEGAANLFFRNVLTGGVRKADAKTLGSAIRHVLPNDGTPESLVRTVLGESGAKHLSNIAQAGENAVKQSLGGGQRRITSFDVPGLEDIAKQRLSKKITSTTVQTPQGPLKVYSADLDDLFSDLLTLKAKARLTLRGPEPAKGFDMRQLAREVEAQIVSLIPDDATKRQWIASRQLFDQGTTARDFLIDSRMVRRGPKGAEVDLGPLQGALEVRAKGQGAHADPNLQRLEEAGLDEFLSAIARGGPVGAQDVTFGGFRVFGGLAPGATSPALGALRGGIPLPSFTRFAGDVPSVLTPGVTAFPSQLGVQTLRRARGQE